MYYNPLNNQQMYNSAGMSYGIPANPIGGFPIGYGGYNSPVLMPNMMPMGNTLQTSGISGMVNGYQVPLGQGMNPYQFTNFGGYYSNNYNAYNPYNLYKQQEELQAQQREEARRTVDILHRLKRASDSYSGRETTQEDLQYISDMYIPKEQEILTYEDYAKEQEKQRRLEIQNRLDSGNMIEYNVPVEQAKARMYKVYTDYTESMPKDVGLFEYLEKYAMKDYTDSINRANEKKAQDVKQLYNSDAYNQSIMKSKSLFGNALDPNISIEDQEIHLPSFISDKTRQERRKAFIESLLGKGEL